MNSLRSRLVLSAAVWIAFVLIIGGLALSYIFQRSVDEAFVRRLEVHVNTLIAATDLNDVENIKTTRSLGDARFEQPLSGWYWQVSSSGRTLVWSRSLWDESLAFEINGYQPGASGTATIQGPRQRNLWVAYRFLQVDGFPDPVLFVVAGDTSDLMDDRREFDLVLILSLLTLGIGVLLALLIQVRYGLKPLNGLVQNLEEIRLRKTDKLGESYPEEILPLIEVTNAVLEENQEQIKRARRHVGNLAHALKTPLTLLKGEIREKVQPPGQEALNDQLGSITNLVEYHLGRASVAGTSALVAHIVPVSEAIEPICRSLEKIHAEKNKFAYLDIPPALCFLGEREDLEEIVGNILENAFKWAKKRVTVSATGGENGLILQVMDDGPGMTEEDMRNSVVRGHRIDEMTPGHGLGLSIVADLVDLYQGSFELSPASTGGLSVSILFPPERLAYQ